MDAGDQRVLRRRRRLFNEFFFFLVLCVRCSFFVAHLYHFDILDGFWNGEGTICIDLRIALVFNDIMVWNMKFPDRGRLEALRFVETGLHKNTI